MANAGGTLSRQTFDAFGNQVGAETYFRCGNDMTAHDIHGLGAPGPAYRDQGGHYQWRGVEGSATDLMHHDMPDYTPGNDPPPTRVVRQAYTARSTGLVYMQARYYEPETGRFTQADPVFYDAVQLLAGQNNRWNYAANSPLCFTDAGGLETTQINTLAAAKINAHLRSLQLPPIGNTVRSTEYSLQQAADRGLVNAAKACIRKGRNVFYDTWHNRYDIVHNNITAVIDHTGEVVNALARGVPPKWDPRWIELLAY